VHDGLLVLASAQEAAKAIIAAAGLHITGVKLRLKADTLDTCTDAM
jgi:hypothetical protein